MGIMNKINSGLANYVNKHLDNDIDKIKTCMISGDVKYLYSSYNDEYFFEEQDRAYRGMINLDNILFEEVRKNQLQDITLCDNGNIICLTNQKGSSYISLDSGEEILCRDTVFIKCNKENYRLAKEYLVQCRHWHNKVIISDKLPHEKLFKKIYHINEKKPKGPLKTIDEKLQETKLEKDSTIKNEKKEQKSENIDYANRIEIYGKISNISDIKQQSDSKKCRYININQRKTYNGHSKDYIITVSIADDKLNEYGSVINVGDYIRTVGEMVIYEDKNRQLKTIVNCKEIEVLEHAMTKEMRDGR